MDKHCILVNVNLFTLNHNIFIITNDGIKSYGTANYARLPGILVGLAKDMNINNIKIAGNNDYACALVNEINTKEQELYSKSELIVEVIWNI